MFSMAKMFGKEMPVLSCGVCGRPVLILELAVVYYPTALAESEMVHAQVLHKDGCFAAAELRDDNSQPHAQWLELTDYIQAFVTNSARLVTELADLDRPAATISMLFAKRG